MKIFPRSEGYPWAWWSDFNDVLEISGPPASNNQSQWFPKVGATSAIPPYGWVSLQRQRGTVVSQMPWIAIPVLPFVIPIPSRIQDRTRFLIQSNGPVALSGVIYQRGDYAQIPVPRIVSSTI